MLDPEQSTLATEILPSPQSLPLQNPKPPPPTFSFGFPI